MDGSGNGRADRWPAALLKRGTGSHDRTLRAVFSSWGPVPRGMAIADLRDAGARRMTDAEIDTFLREQGVGVLALPGQELPYVLPLSFGYDGDAHLYFTYLLFGAESKKETLSKRADIARFLVFAAESMHQWHSVLLTGDLRELPEQEWDRLQSAMENAWHPNLFATATPMRGITGYEFAITERHSLKHVGEGTGR